MKEHRNTITLSKKPLILRLAVERKIENDGEEFVYDPQTSMNRYRSGKIDYASIMELMTKTEQGREEDRNDCETILLDCMTKTFSSREADD